MVVAGDLDLSEIPIKALRDRTRKRLGVSLNGLKVIPTDVTDIPRDWRGVAHFAGVSTSELSQSKNPIEEVLRLWSESRVRLGEKPVSITELQKTFGDIDRWDTYDDTEEMMLADAVQYIASMHAPEVADGTTQPFQNNCLTSEDIDRFQQGLPLITYDAFLLYANEDIEYARVMIDKLENDYNLRLIVKDRDLLSGIGFEHSAITKLIEERCSSLIVILSPNLLNSEANMFFLEFAHSLSISQQKKRIIPCKYEPCDLPREIRYLYCLDYERARLFGNFWERIKNSVLASIEMAQVQTPPLSQNLSDRNRCIVTEVHSEDIQSPIEQTAIIKMSDLSTHYPGNSLKNSPENGWLGDDENIAHQSTKQTRLSWPFKKTTNERVEGVPCRPMKTEKKSKILNVFKKKKNKLFPKKTAVACEA